MFRAQEVLRKHVLGEGPVSIQVTSDHLANFGRVVNYENPNISVQLPIFIIHGNHDDPTREGINEQSLSALDLLAEQGLINYFGRADRVDDIKVRPVLIEKGERKLALYGLGWIRDERLFRMFTQKKVSFTKIDDPENEWFNIMLIHQNRSNRGRGEKNCVTDAFIPDFLNLVVWGHEHESLIDPINSNGKYISQPGSSIAVSLVESESKKKKFALLRLTKTLDKDNQVRHGFYFKAIALESVRPFLFVDDIELSKVEELSTEIPEANKQEAVVKYLTDYLNNLLSKHIESLNDSHQDERTRTRNRVPIVRLKVEYTGFPIINFQRFGAHFSGKVANPEELLQFYRKKKLPTGTTNAVSSGIYGTEDEDQDLQLQYESPHYRIQKLVEQILNESEKTLELFNKETLHEAVEEFVEKETTSAIEHFVDDYIDKIQKLVRSERIGNKSDDIEKLISSKVEKLHKKEQAQKSLKEEPDSLLPLKLPNRNPGTDTEEEKEESKKKSTRKNSSKTNAKPLTKKKDFPKLSPEVSKTKRMKQDISSDESTE